MASKITLDDVRPGMMVSPEEARQILGYKGKRTLARRVKQGLPPRSFKVGRMRKYLVSDLIAFIESGSSE